MKRSVKMRGFMCQDPTATAMCITSDPRSVIMPRRADRTLAEHASLIHNSTKSAKIIESRKFDPPSKRPSTNVRKEDGVKFIEKNQKNLHRLSLATPMDQATPHRLSLATPTDQATPHRLSLATPTDQIIQVSCRNQTVDPVFSSQLNVVVMRVSLHCQGCAGKLKKHLSKMEGVTSFSIELENKRVTVRGNVSPVRVLESISKVKKAEFWPC